MRLMLDDILRLNHMSVVIISGRSQGDIKAVLDRENKGGQATDTGVGHTIADALTDLEDALNET